MKVAIMGYGTIGSGVAKILEDNAGVIAERVGEPLELKSVLDLREFEGDPIQPKIVHDYQIIAEDPEITLVVETMGGVEPAYTFVKAMLEAGKHVTTSNKALVAEKGADLIATAKEHNVSFLFEASVGGGIPIIRTMLSALTGDVIEEITGIVNGTTNYMMTAMSEDGSDFDDVLKEAQRLGYAEKDPSADIEGADACRKIAILTSLAAGAQVDYEDIPTEGITNISSADFKYAKELNRVIKLLAVSRKTGDTYAIRVAPFLIEPDHALAPVHGVFNAVFLRSDMLGDSMYYGSGAGSLPTASAVVGDLVELARNRDTNLPITWSEEKITIFDPNEETYSYFVRTTLSEEEAKAHYDVDRFVDAGVDGEIGLVTKETAEKDLDREHAVNVIRLG